MTDLYSIPVQTLQGETTTLASYRDQVLLVVNVASRCGFTPQYEGLQALHEEFQEAGFSVLGFPCNQFLWQEPRSNAKIAAFCESQFRVTFPLFDKVRVNGFRAHPLFKVLKRSARGVIGSSMIKWNFTKFLVGRGGETIERFAPFVEPERLRTQIKTELNRRSVQSTEHS